MSVPSATTGSVEPPTTPPIRAMASGEPAYHPRPRGRTPRGKGWDPLTGQWVPEEEAPPSESAEDPKRTASATGKRPRGRAPRGKVWDDASASWVDGPADAPAQEPKPSPAKRPRMETGAENGSGGGDETGRVDDSNGGAAERVVNNDVGDVSAAAREASERAAAMLASGIPSATTNSPAKPSPAKQPKTKSNRPRGRPPAGKTWDTERQVWLNEDGTVFQRKQSSPGKPRGRPPRHHIWDSEKLQWVREPGAPLPVAPPIMVAKKPRGRPPKGKVWDTVSASWVDAPKLDAPPVEDSSPAVPVVLLTGSAPPKPPSSVATTD